MILVANLERKIIIQETSHWLFVSDIDDTLLGDDPALLTLTTALHIPSLIVVYNSSRPCASLRQTLADNPYLPIPHYLIGALGTEIEIGATGEPLDDYRQHLDTRWNRAAITEVVAFFDLKPHPDEYQTPFKISFDLRDGAVYQAIIERLAAHRLIVKTLHVANRSLDIIPYNAGKRFPLLYLCQRHAIPLERVVVAGDSENDLEMFTAPIKGIVVANATATLKQLHGSHIFHASQPYAKGVLEGLQHWGIVG